MPLYKTTVTVDIPLIIVGEEPPGHEQITSAAVEEWENSWHLLDMVIPDPVEVTTLKQLPDGWEEAIPYGYNPEQETVKQLLGKRGRKGR